MSNPRSRSRSRPQSAPPSPSPVHPPPNPRHHTREVRDSQSGREESFSLLPPSPAPEPNTSPRGPRRLIRPAGSDPSSEAPVAKRPRIDSPPRQTEGNTMPSSGSATHLAAHGDPASGQTVVPPKKKRTRTLTTPHQAAVLHALLAQSRFPTTAMREEVGRSIGLSARKVQIWFQNQRQKARRPRSQSEASSTRPPPYSAFPSFPQHDVPGSFPLRPEDNPLPLMPSSSSGLYLHNTSTSNPELPQLLGPGVPGLDPRSSGGPLVRARAGSLLSHSSHGVGHTVAGPSRLPSQVTPTQSPTASSFSSHFQDPYRTLPPLTPDSRTGIGSSLSVPSAQPATGQLPFIDPNPAHFSTVELPFIHYRPSEHQGYGFTPRSSSGSFSSVSMPPPFTLQPQPQWDARSFTPSLTRPSIWSTPSPSNSSPSPSHAFLTPSPAQPSLVSISSPNLRRGTTEIEPTNVGAQGDTQPATSPTSSPPAQRMGRYDPVRAAVIPLSRQSPPKLSPPSRIPD